MPRIIVDLSLASRLALTIAYIAMLWNSYCVMLLVMTFNYPILITLCGGMMVGNFVAEMIGLPQMPIQYK